jgi:hypothetical protein
MLSPVQGYLSVENIEMYMRYFVEEDFAQVKWEQFQEKFVSKFNQN